MISDINYTSNILNVMQVEILITHELFSIETEPTQKLLDLKQKLTEIQELNIEITVEKKSDLNIRALEICIDFIINLQLVDML